MVHAAYGQVLAATRAQLDSLLRELRLLDGLAFGGLHAMRLGQASDAVRRRAPAVPPPPPPPPRLGPQRLLRLRLTATPPPPARPSASPWRSGTGGAHLFARLPHFALACAHGHGGGRMRRARWRRPRAQGDAARRCGGRAERPPERDRRGRPRARLHGLRGRRAARAVARTPAERCPSDPAAGRHGDAGETRRGAASAAFAACAAAARRSAQRSWPTPATPPH